MDACTGDRGADIDEGGVGTPRNCCSFSRSMEISLFASSCQLSHWNRVTSNLPRSSSLSR